MELRSRTPDLRSVADIRLVCLEDGPGRGQRLLQARNGSGIQFEVAVDRGFDISGLSLAGVNLGWHAPTQMTFPSADPDSEQGWGFLRNFDGFMVTCGLDHFGRPQEVDVSHYDHPQMKTRPMPFHGRFSAERARLVAYDVDADAGLIYCEGIVRQASVFGEYLELRRKITLPVFGTELTIDDTVVNRGFHPSHHAILYHLNFGYPFLDAPLELSGLPPDLAASVAADPALPRDDYGEKVDVAKVDDMPGGARVVLTNPALGKTVAISFDEATLPLLGVWRTYQSGTFALGIEPRTETAARLPLLEPGGTRRYSVRLNLQDGRAVA